MHPVVLRVKLEITTEMPTAVPMFRISVRIAVPPVRRFPGS